MTVIRRGVQRACGILKSRIPLSSIKYGEFADGDLAGLKLHILAFTGEIVGAYAVDLDRGEGIGHLIDAAGDPVGALDWAWGPDVWSLDALELPVIPIQEGDGYRIIDRRGNYVTDEVFRSAGTTFGGRLMLTDRDGSLCLMDGAGNIALRASAEEWSFYDGDAEAVWILRDGLWGRMAATGERAGEWLIPPAYAGHERLDGGGFYLKKPDGTAVYADESGAELGPARAYADDNW